MDNKEDNDIPRIIVEVQGGVVDCVYVKNLPSNTCVTILDWDNAADNDAIKEEAMNLSVEVDGNDWKDIY